MLKTNGKHGVNLTTEQLEQYQQDGILYVESFYDLEKEILPIQQDIYRLIRMINEQQCCGIQQEPFSPENFDSGLQDMIETNRDSASILYDAVKKLTSYIRLANSQKNEDLSKLLLGSDFVGFANRGYGMRMDHPNEDKLLTQWHQDYISQLCSPRGVVLWSPLRDVTLELGPVVLCPGSHQDGIFPIIRDGEGSHGLKIKNEVAVVQRYQSVIPEVKAGDLVAIDYLTLHCSSPNRSPFTRWSMISRYFDFLDKTGAAYGWKGGLQEGLSFATIHPELAEIR